MSNVEQKRRELFEAWLKKTKPRVAQDMLDEDEFVSRWMFEAFNAAIDAVEINFPQEEHYWPHDYCGAVEDCRDAIEKTGLGLKVK